MANSSEKIRLYVIALLLLFSEIVYLWIYSGGTRVITYFYISVINSALFAAAAILSRNAVVYQKHLLYLFLISGLIFRLTLLPSPPTASDDIYRYIWDGRVQSNGINPYRYAPNDMALSFLHTEDLPGKVNFPSMKTIYPPFSQYMFYLSYSIFGQNLLGFKAILMFFEILLCIALVYLVKKLGCQLHYAGLYAICPLPIMQFMIDQHLDSIGIALMIAGLTLYMRKRLNSEVSGRVIIENNRWSEIAGLVLIGLSISSKLISAMILPFLYRKDKSLKQNLILLASPLTFMLTYIPYISRDVFPFESLMTFTSHWVYNGSVFTLIFGVVDNNQKARMICGILFMIAAAVLFFIKGDKPGKIQTIFLMFFLLSPTVHPWYLCWLAGLLALNFRWSLLAFVSLASLANHIVIAYQLHGIWQENYYILMLEYVPVYGLIAYEMHKYYYGQLKRRPASA